MMGSLASWSVTRARTYVPDRATMSVLLRPFLANAASSVLRLNAGEGRSVLAVDRLAVVESVPPAELHRP